MSARSVARRLLALAALASMAACSASGPAALPTPTGSSPTTGGASAPGNGPDVGPRPEGLRTALDVAAFVDPEGRIVCMLGAVGARCDYFAEDQAWQAPRPGNCDLDVGSSLSVDRTAGTSCVGDSIVGKAALGAGLDSWRKPGDPTVSWDGRTLVALPYSSTLLVGTFRCDSATAGVTCQNESTGHGFFMSRASIRIF